MSNYEWDVQVYITNLLIETMPNQYRNDEVLRSIGLDPQGRYGVLQLLLTSPIRQKIGGLEEPELTQWKTTFAHVLTEAIEDDQLSVIATLNLQPMIRTIVFRLKGDLEEKEEQSYLEDNYNRLTKQLYQRYGFGVIGCFGSIFTEFFDIGTIYRKVRKLQAYHYCIGVGRCAFDSDFMMDQGHSLVEYKYLHHFEQLIKEEDWLGINELVTTIATTLKMHPVKDSKTAYICKELFSITIRHFLKESGSHEGEIRQLNEGIIMFDDLFDDIGEVVHHYLDIISIASANSVEGSIHPHIRKTLTLIHTSFKEPITLEGTADQLGLSTAYLSRLFKAETAITFKGYLTGYRIDLAKKMLTESTKKIEQIRKDVGYQSQSQFARAFKKREGLSASQYRQLYRQ